MRPDSIHSDAFTWSIAAELVRAWVFGRGEAERCGCLRDANANFIFLFCFPGNHESKALFEFAREFRITLVHTQSDSKNGYKSDSNAFDFGFRTVYIIYNMIYIVYVSILHHSFCFSHSRFEKYDSCNPKVSIPNFHFWLLGFGFCVFG